MKATKEQLLIEIPLESGTLRVSLNGVKLPPKECSVARFVAAACRIDSLASTSKDELHARYTAWCKAQNVAAESKATFGLRLKRIAPTGDGKLKINGKRVNAHTGIALSGVRS
jgi:hypothetical protein